MFEEGNYNENEHLSKKFKKPEGNYALSAEILEQVPEADAVQCIDGHFQGFPVSESRRPDDPVDCVQILGSSGRAASAVDRVQAGGCQFVVK